jgi:AcrR family transcriptional regulator
MGNVTHNQKHRIYQQKQRAEAAAATRQRVIEATRHCLTEVALHNVGLDEIATEAGVARSTIYAAFVSRAGLFEAVAEDALSRGGLVALQQASREADALLALKRSLQEAMRMYAAEHAIAQALLSLAAVDRDAAGAAERLNRGRAAGMIDLAQRLEQQQFLLPGMTIQEAADILWVLTSFETFDQLYSGRGLSPDETGKRLIAMATRSLCNQEALASRG